MTSEPAALDRLNDGRDESPTERADRNWLDLLQELRATQTGTQVLAGFLLTLPFQERFSTLDSVQITLYLTLVGLASFVTIVGLAPVILHRMLFRQQVKGRLVTFGNRLLKVMLALVALLAIGVSSLLFDVVAGRTAGIVAGAVAALVVLVVVFVAFTQRRLVQRDDDASQ